MGLFDFTKKFRTGRTAARKAGDAAAAQATVLGNQTLDEQQALKTEIGGMYQPMMDQGSTAFNEISDYYAGNQQPILDQAMSSPFMSQLVNQSEQAIARNAQATGGFRSGSTQENLAGNSQNVLMSLVNQVLQGKQGIANAGMGAADAYSTASQNIQAGVGGTRGQIANIDIANAAQKTNQAAGITGMYGSIIGGSIKGGTEAATAAAMSDIRLKKNVVKVDEKHDLPWYTWDWNSKAKELGLTGSDEGHIAQEVQNVRPELVVERNGYLAINYGGF
tara:strand:- start:1575 stop:2405 length:831 start_codon:yes stop_codon:yes gene_type:complete